MRLLQCTANQDQDIIQVSLTEYASSQIPPYAILSHRWRDEEVEYQHMTSDVDYKNMRGYPKIEQCARAALEYGIHHIWVDTCCINKSSSAELSEAINSMYLWYNDSLICFAFLDDVSYERGKLDFTQVRTSSWFTRGWTLQELIAPKTMVFYSKEWSKLGSRIDLANTISVASGIDIKILQNTRHLDSASVSEKMSWAATRETTRIEDVAYSLMGLFSVSMPTLYGEGSRAFRRLQLEIMQSTNDHTLFAWEDTTCNGDMLASSPRQFKDCHVFQPISYPEFISRFGIHEPKPDFSMTNAGLHIQLPMLTNPTEKSPDSFIAFLACVRVDPVNRIFARIFLERTDDQKFSGFHRVVKYGHTIEAHFNPTSSNVATQTIWISPKRVRVAARREEEYIPSRVITMDAKPSKRDSWQMVEGFVGNLRRRSTMRLGIGSARRRAGGAS
ncbi:HET-domain-containing protein [Cucurbitaria berberidis CBS 394.84]|uniref:HET-domain-containing protein n=1 Tax=Cucurbitaria berberidis CBS 394.84 TaxID=1168544 RepID=A0A9P4GI11_9PLEO|nr:HET-domain-containing protein [Cucurbitaria berberidis CBS 394.84]KAF1846538.1 HET-domain-containing protein [Cucurbitaria berberidis CBS 394.84]